VKKKMPASYLMFFLQPLSEVRYLKNAVLHAIAQGILGFLRMFRKPELAPLGPAYCAANRQRHATRTQSGSADSFSLATFSTALPPKVDAHEDPFR
jgi:hypothetical protein